MFKMTSMNRFQVVCYSSPKERRPVNLRQKVSWALRGKTYAQQRKILFDFVNKTVDIAEQRFLDFCLARNYYHARENVKKNVNRIAKRTQMRIEQCVRGNRWMQTAEERSVVNALHAITGCIFTPRRPKTPCCATPGTRFQPCWCEIEEGLLLQEHIPDPPKKKKFDKTTIPPPKSQLVDDGAIFEEVVHIRDPKLVASLRLKILLLVIRRVKKNRQEQLRAYLLKRIDDVLFQECLEEPKMEYFEDDIVGQMMEPEVSLDQRSNVVLLNTTGKTEDTTLDSVSSSFWSSVCVSDKTHRYPELADRWTLLHSDTWTRDHPRGTILKSWSLPFDFLKNNDASPNMAPFAQYAYWRGDIKIRVHLNTNVFNVGQLILSWYYMSEFDKNVSSRRSRASSVQLPHVMIKASESNDVELTIPFRSFKAAISMYKRRADDKNAHMGTLRLQVMNPLLYSPEDVVKAITYLVYISFPNSEFYGMVPRDTSDFSVSGQMFPIMTAKKVVNLASDALDMFIPDPSRDDPPIIARPTPVYVLPTPSMASGDQDVEDISVMRLQPAGQTPHPSGSSTSVDEMSLDYLKTREGLLCTREWSLSHDPGTVLLEIPASPIQNCYETIEINSPVKRNCTVYTPIHNLTNMFSYYRGTLKLKLEFVRSHFQVGSIMVAYLPRRNKTINSSNSLDILKHCYHTIIDISQADTFDFKIPFIADKPLWPKYEKYNIDATKLTIDAPGSVYVVVVNKMVPIRMSIPEAMEINFYLSAMPDFELTLLSNPRIGLCWNTSSASHGKNNVIVDPAYREEAGFGTWRYLGGDRVLCRYGNGSDHVTQFINLKYRQVYKISEYGNINPNDLVQEVKFYDPIQKKWNNYTLELKFLCRVIVNGDKDKYQYATLFPTRELADNFVMMCPPDYGDSPVLYLPQLTQKRDYIKLGADWGEVVFSEVIETLNDIEGFENIVGQNDPEILLDPSIGGLNSIQQGRLMFGERFDCLKSACRRYQPYDIITIVSGEAAKENALTLDGFLPINVNGVDLDLNSPYFNMNRQGFIPYVASAFRFFRGSLRFKFVVRGNPTGTLYIQHVYDNCLKENHYVSVPVLVELASHTIQPGYPLVVQNLDTNNTISIEVPFYLPTPLGLLQEVDSRITVETINKCLGYLAICFNPKGPNYSQKCIIDVFYSIADDMKFSGFVGFPPVFEVATIEDHQESITGQAPFWESKKKVMDPCITTCIVAAGFPPLIKNFLLASTRTMTKEHIQIFKNILPDVDTIVKEHWQDMPKYRDLDLSLVIPSQQLSIKAIEDTILKDYYKIWYRALPTHRKEGDFAAAYAFSTSNFVTRNTERFVDASKRVVDPIVADAKENMKKVLNDGNASIWDMLSGMTDLIGKDCKLILVNCFAHLGHVLLNPSIKTFALALVAVLATLGLICTSMVGKLITLFQTVYRKIFAGLRTFAGQDSPPPSQTNVGEGEEIIANSEDLSLSQDEKATLVSTLVGGITGALAVGPALKNSKNYPDFTKNLFSGVGNIARTSNFLTIFFKNNLLMFQKIIRWVGQKICPRKSFQMCLDDDKEYMQKWLEDVDDVLNPANKDKVMLDPAWNLRVYQASVVAMAYKVKFARSDIKCNPALLSMCNDVIALRDELTRFALSPPVRFEPYVICVGGESNVGKSHLVNNLVSKLLEKIDYKTYAETIFTRTPGNKYWNGCFNQPFVLYDDFMQVISPEQEATDMAEIFNLKSKAVFNPLQAAVEEKKIRYNPLGVFLCMNKPYRKPSCVADATAYLRRRDCLIIATKKSEYKDIHPRDLPQDVKERYGHLLFDIKKSAVTEDAGNIHSAISYEEMVAYVSAKFETFYREELQQYNERLSIAAKFYPDAEESIGESLARYEKHLRDINSPYLEKLRRENPCCVKKAEVVIDYEVQPNVPSFQITDLCQGIDMGIQTEVEVIKRHVSVNTDMVDLPRDVVVVDSSTNTDPQEKIRQRLPHARITRRENPKCLLCSCPLYGSCNACPCDLFAGCFFKINGEIRIMRERESVDKIVSQGPEDMCGHGMFDPKTWVYSSCIVTDYAEWGFDFVVNATRDTEVFFDPAQPKRWVHCEECSNPKCYWKINPKIKIAQLEAWRAANKESFALYQEDVASTSQATVRKIPKFFTKVKDSDVHATAQHVEKMSKVKNFMSSTRKDFKEEVQNCSKLKKMGLWMLRKVKWLLKKLLVVVSCGLFLVAAQSIAGYVGSKCEVFPYKEFNCNTNFKGGAKLIMEDAKKLVKKVNPVGEMAYENVIPSKSLKPSMAKNIVSQLAPDVQTNIAKILTRNTFFLYLEKDEGQYQNMRCLGIKDRTAIILDHYFFQCRANINHKFYFISQGIRIPFRFQDCKIQALENSAIYFIRFPNNIPCFKDIRKYFIMSCQTSTLSSDGILYELKLNSDYTTTMTTHSLPISFEKQLSFPNSNGPDTNTFHLYSYPIGAPGMCVSVLCTVKNVSNPIIGLHIAGKTNGKKGFAESIVQGTFDSVTFGHINDVEEPELDPDIEPHMGLGNLNVLQHGCVSNKLMHFSPLKSSQKHSMCYQEIYPSTYDFPLLSDRDPRIASNPFSPMLAGVSYHAIIHHPFRNDLLLRARDYYNNKLQSVVRPLRRKIGVLSPEESIAGMDIEHYDALEFNTSPGFPFVSTRPPTTSGKKYLFGLEETSTGYNCTSIAPELSDVIRRKERLRASGIVPFTVFTDCLKDLKMPSEKALIPGKTRIFSISPVDFTIQCRQYFLDYSVAYQEARFAADHAIGIDIKSIEWSQLAFSLTTISDHIIVADYKKFGPTLMSSVVMCVFDIIINWYKENGDDSPEHELVRRVMAEETAFSYHLMFNVVYQVACGSPSGHPLTTIINSHVNCLYILYCWLVLGYPIEEYDKNVKLVTYGDDLIMSVSSSYLPLFNCKIIADELFKYGIVLTDVGNKNDVVASRNLLDPEVTFLKCNFSPHPFRHHILLAQLQERAVKEICNWIFSGLDDKEQSIVACQAMLENAFGHGPDFYEEMRMKVLKYWQEKRVFVPIPTWHEVSDRCFGSDDVPYYNVVKIKRKI